MNEIKEILKNLFILIFLTITLFLLGSKSINKIVINIIIMLFGTFFLYVYFILKKKYAGYNYSGEFEIHKRYKIKKRLMYIRKIKTFFFTFLFIFLVITFWFGNFGKLWLAESVHFFKKRFTNKYLLNIAIFLVPLIYWISIESIFRNICLYFQKKYKLDEIEN